MTTQQLIALQKSITQGEWHTNSLESVRHTIHAHRGHVADVSRGTMNEVSPDEIEANSQAIALTPQLIAEVIRLRIALGNIVNDCAPQEINADGICTSRPSLLTLEQCPHCP